MACSKAEDLINQLIEATLKLLEFGLNIMDALRVQKLLALRNQKIGLISDDACLPECSLRFSLNFDLMMFNKLLRNACLRARATLNELRVCRLRYPNAPLVLEPKTKVKFHKLQRKIQEFDEAVRSDKMIARRDLRDFREISIIFSQLEHDLKLLICSLECASTMKDTVLFAAPITDVMTVLSIVLSRLESLAQKAEIDEKTAAVEQQKVLQGQKPTSIPRSNSAAPYRRQHSTAPTVAKNRNSHVLFNARNTNRTSRQQRQDMTTMFAVASQQNIPSHSEKKALHQRESKSFHSDTPQTSRSDQSLKESVSIDHNNDHHHHLKLPRRINRHYPSIKSKVSRHRQTSTKTSIEHIPDEAPSNRRQIKQLRNEFIEQWTADARQIYAQKHIRHASHIQADQMTNVDLEKIDRQRKKRTHQRHRSVSSSSTLLNKRATSASSSHFNDSCKNKAKVQQSSNSISLPSTMANQSNIKQTNTSSNRSPVDNHHSENIECKIS